MEAESKGVKVDQEVKKEVTEIREWMERKHNEEKKKQEGIIEEKTIEILQQDAKIAELEKKIENSEEQIR